MVVRSKAAGGGAGMRLSTRFAILVAVIIAVVLAAYIPISYQVQLRAAEEKALAEARVLDVEIQAVWDYINTNQNRINYNSDGTFDFKGVYCTIAAKAVAENFTRKVDFGIRFVRESPRSATNTPNAFETKALSVFETRGADEYYEVSSQGDRPTLNYASVLRIEGNCLDCHGDPAGEKDLTGFKKEGMKLGDVAGAVSITVPMDRYEGEVRRNIASDIVYSGLLIIVVVVAVWLAMRRWIILPLRKLEKATAEVGEGVYSTGLDPLQAKGEIKSLQENFRVMAEQLESIHGTLESKVSARTAELRQLNELLVDQQRKTERYYRDLERANELLQQENEYKSNFLTIMSHELRTPLAAIIAFTELWEKSGGTDAEEASYVKEIKGNGMLLLSMVDNIIDAARLEADRFELSVDEVDLVDVVNSIEAVVKPLALEKDIEVTASVDAAVPIIYSDWEAVRKIVTNLVSNALKFGRAGGFVSVAVSYDEAAEMVSIAVADDGIGISGEDIERIFGQFVQADSSIKRRYGGSGLGLSLAKELSAKLGGDISVESEEGKGSVFTVRLPLSMEGGAE